MAAAESSACADATERTNWFASDASYSCLLDSCTDMVKPSALREHCHVAHLPKWMQDTGDLTLTVTRRTHAVMWLLQIINESATVETLTSSELVDLWLKISRSELLDMPAEVGDFQFDFDQVDGEISRLVCENLGEAVPNSSVGLYAHWAIMMKLLNKVSVDLQMLFRYLPFIKSPGWDMVDAHFHIDRLAQKFHLMKGVDQVLQTAPQPPENTKGFLTQAVANFCDTCQYRSVLPWLGEKAEVMLYATVGLHPKEAAGLTLSEAERHITSMMDFQKNERVVGVGEIGLDYSLPDLSTDDSRLRQQEIFQKILSHVPPGTPVVIHCRNGSKGKHRAEKDIFSIIKQCPVPFPVQLHCFTGNVDTVKKYLGLEREVYFSISNHSLNGSNFGQTLREIPTSRILVETDSPYLSPLGRGHNNSPRLVGVVAERLAALMKISVQQVLWMTAANARRLFHLP